MTLLHNGFSRFSQYKNISKIFLKKLEDTQQDDTEHNDTQQSDTQHKET
jgi:hypothetical protein